MTAGSYYLFHVAVFPYPVFLSGKGRIQARYYCLLDLRAAKLLCILHKCIGIETAWVFALFFQMDSEDCCPRFKVRQVYKEYLIEPALFLKSSRSLGLGSRTRDPLSATSGSTVSSNGLQGVWLAREYALPRACLHKSHCNEIGLAVRVP